MTTGFSASQRMRFSFCEEDHERYGAGAWTFDPVELMRRPTRELVAIEAAIGQGIPGLLARLTMPQDRRYTESLLAATWVARRMAGIDEAWGTYEPLVYLMTVEPDEGDADPPAGASSPSAATEG